MSTNELHLKILRPRHLRRLAVLATVALFTCVVGVANAVAPVVTTGATESVTSTSVVLTGTVDPKGVATNYYFEYGKTASYGNKTAVRSAGNSEGALTVKVGLTGLAANTVYQYRLVADGDGVTQGAQRAVRTAPTVVPEPSKIGLDRATISKSARTIDILAPITTRASGSVNLSLRAAGQTHSWTAPINSTDGRIRNVETIPAAQAAKGTGILTMTYPGDSDTRPQTVRLRAANNRANLDSSRPTLDTTNGLLKANGTISSKAKGVVRVQLEYYSNGQTTTIEKNAAVSNGTWALQTQLDPTQLAAIKARRGVVHSYILYTGYLRENMRGEMVSYQVLGGN